MYDSHVLYKILFPTQTLPTLLAHKWSLFSVNSGRVSMEIIEYGKSFPTSLVFTTVRLQLVVNYVPVLV